MPWSGQRACRFAFEEWFWLKFGNENRSRPQHKPTSGYSCGVNQYFQATSHLFQKDGVSWFAKRTPLIAFIRNMPQHPGNHPILTKANVAALNQVDDFLESVASRITAKDYYALLVIAQRRILSNQKIYMETNKRSWTTDALDVLRAEGGSKMPINGSSVTNKSGNISESRARALLKDHFEEVLSDGVVRAMQAYIRRNSL